MRVKDKTVYDELVTKNQETVDKNKKSSEKFKTKISKLDDEIDGFKQSMADLRQYLEENPKYAILFLVQDLKKAKIGEIQKALAIAPPITIKLVRSLENEGWVKIDEGGPEMEVEMVKDFIPG